MKLRKNYKYLQIALNSTLEEAREIIFKLPLSERILIEAGTPLIKDYGKEAILELKKWSIERILGPQRAKEESKKNSLPFEPYIVADLKCMDLGTREVEIATVAGASAATCLGTAPIETINKFIESCQEENIDSMIDMMNVENPLMILKKIKKLPDAVILHRGVDETKISKEKQIPYYQIKQIKGNYSNILVSVAGGDTIKEIQQAVFNDTDIVVLWESFYHSTQETAKIAEQFLKEIR